MGSYYFNTPSLPKVEFTVNNPDSETQKFSVSIKDDGVTIYRGKDIPGAELTCRVSLSSDDLKRIYSGSLSSASIASLCFSRRIVVHHMKFSELSSFASSFDFTKDAWERYYQYKDDLHDDDSGHAVLEDTGSLLEGAGAGKWPRKEGIEDKDRANPEDVLRSLFYFFSYL